MRIHTTILALPARHHGRPGPAREQRGEVSPGGTTEARRALERQEAAVRSGYRPKNAYVAGKSTTMLLILGLDRPQSGTATIGGLGYTQLARPLKTVGALLEARSVHTGRSARNHLLFLAQTQGFPARRWTRCWTW
jgi:ABC-2 type transport system ATP-binding protein